MEFRCLKFRANALDYALCVLLGRVRQHKKKFFASNTAAYITASSVPSRKYVHIVAEF
jgi:hypothetical protein